MVNMKITRNKSFLVILLESEIVITPSSAKHLREREIVLSSDYCFIDPFLYILVIIVVQRLGINALTMFISGFALAFGAYLVS